MIPRMLIALAVGVATSLLISWPWWLLTVLPIAVLISVIPIPARASRTSDKAPCQSLMKDLGHLAGEHRFLRHTTAEGDVCYCGWRDQNEPHCYHQAQMLLGEFDIRRKEEADR